jgi:antirestriction protein ArdC
MTYHTKETKTKKPFHETVAERLIEQLKAGTAPWQQPWEFSGYLPMNPATGKRYQGINAILLLSEGRSDTRWMIYKQAAAINAQVRKGKKGTAIQYWKLSETHVKLDGNGHPLLDAKGQPIKESVKLKHPRVFFATVFNAEQIDGLPSLQSQEKKEQSWNAIERAEHILNASGATIEHAPGDGAFYRLLQPTDTTVLPERSQFPSADRYYATALPGQHVAYVASWIKTLKDALHKSPRRVHLRTRAVCGVANPRHSYGYGLRLASHPDPQRPLTARLMQSIPSRPCKIHFTLSEHRQEQELAARQRAKRFGPATAAAKAGAQKGP